jgi:hypothetical protein
MCYQNLDTAYIIAAMQFKLASKLIEGGVDVSIAIAGVTL